MQPLDTPDEAASPDPATDYVNRLRAVPDDLLALALRAQTPRKLNRMEMRAVLAQALPEHARQLTAQADGDAA